MKLTWEKIKLWCFHHWRMLVVAALIIIYYGVGRKNVTAYKTQLTMARELYRKEVDAIEKAHKDEVRKIEKARVLLETTMREIEFKYAEAEKKLDAKKKKQVEKIIKENHNDPDAITEKLASLTGFKIYVE